MPYVKDLKIDVNYLDSNELYYLTKGISDNLETLNIKNLKVDEENKNIFFKMFILSKGLKKFILPKHNYSREKIQKLIDQQTWRKNHELIKEKEL
jgi:hypothetical protein